LDSNEEEKSFKEHIDKKASWIQKWRKKGIFWEKVLTVGAIGWMVVLPMVIGGYIGRYLDRHLSTGPETVSWTMTFIIIGLFVAIYSVWKVFLYKK
jgi:ATP synthase protein I